MREGIVLIIAVISIVQWIKWKITTQALIYYNEKTNTNIQKNRNGRMHWFCRKEYH